MRNGRVAHVTVAPSPQWPLSGWLLQMLLEREVCIYFRNEEVAVLFSSSSGLELSSRLLFPPRAPK